VCPNRGGIRNDKRAPFNWGGTAVKRAPGGTSGELAKATTIAAGVASGFPSPLARLGEHRDNTFRNRGDKG
jgi:hypothetical protein